MKQTIVTGKIIHGNKMGRKLGFPTANLDELKPKIDDIERGVYACVCFLPDAKRYGEGMKKQIAPEEYAKKLKNSPKIPEFSDKFPYPGLLHIGPRSTFGDEKLQWEVFLLDFDYDIYDEEMVVIVGKFIRGSKKFDNVDRLIEAMKQDEKKARETLLV